MNYWENVSNDWVNSVFEMWTPKTREQAVAKVKTYIDTQSARSRIEILETTNRYLTDEDRDTLRQYAKRWEMQSIRFELATPYFILNRPRWQ